MRFIPIAPSDNSIKGLVSVGILRPLQGVYVLQTPLIIKFSEKTSEEMLGRYDPNYEIGGVILAEPTILNGNRVLSVSRIVFLENISTTPQKQFSRPNIRSDIQAIWETQSKRDQRLYIPIFFHSHPTVRLDDVDSLNDLIYSVMPLKTSEADQSFSLSVEISMNNIKFRVPNALIVHSEIGEQKTLIGFYGGGITPLDFGKYLLRLTGKTIKELWESLQGWIEEDPRRMLILLILGGLGVMPILLFPKQAIPLYLVLIIILLGSQIIPISAQEVDGLPNYFAAVKSEGTMVRIPELE